ncbi:MAG: hypothetical protein FJ164_12385 [Gammaproteobacteria bacterium]|nr:hypothetical protein [Gammaproteobacteria bacterium]
MRGTLKWGMMTLQLSPNSLNPAIHRQFMANLWQGLRAALLRAPEPRASLCQLLLLLATGWGCALLVDRGALSGEVAVAPWGVVAEAARSYFWLATLAAITLLPRLCGAFLPLAVCLAAADIVVWLAWYLMGLILPRLPMSAAAAVQAELWWLFLVWQVAIFAVALRAMIARAATSVSLRFARLQQIIAVVLYAMALQVNLNLLPDYPLWEEVAQTVPALDVETVYYRQPTMTAQALSAVAPGVPGKRELFVVSFAGYGGQDVFKHEAQQVAGILGEQYQAATRTVTLINNPATVETHPLASRSNLAWVLKGLSARMQRDEDILFLFLTSHGAEDGEFAVELGELGLNSLTPEDLGQLLDEAGIRWRVVVVSACYSGQFAPALATPETLLITAAAPDKSSFGCAHARRWTYFGAAYFRDALATTPSFTEAFEQAKREVERRERGEGKEPSLPQMHLGAEIREVLADFEQGLSRGR